MFRYARLLALILLFSLFGCAKPPAPPLTFVSDDNAARQTAQRMRPAGQDMQSWMDMEEGVRRSLAYVSVKPQGATAVRVEDFSLTWGELRRSLEELLEVLPRLDAEPDLLAEHFRWYRLSQGALMTGYYAPYIEASPVRTPEYRYPLYGVPEDLRTLDLGDFHHRWKGQRLVYRMENGKPVPYYDRQEIDFEGALRGRGEEVAWAKNIVDVFFLQIQGSGLLHYPDGTTHHILYAGKNGRKYVSLGKILIQRGMLTREGVSMKSIRDYLAEHPEEIPDLLATNPSYVFFRVGTDGPYGAMGKLLTPKVSVATDPKFLPLGSVLAFEADFPPEAPGEEGERIAGLGLAQDTGGAIKGARLDWYCGSGPDVEYFAGHIKAPASVYMLVSKEVLKR